MVTVTINADSVREFGELVLSMREDEDARFSEEAIREKVRGHVLDFLCEMKESGVFDLPEVRGDPCEEKT